MRCVRFFDFGLEITVFWPQKSYTLNFRKNWVQKNLGFGQKWSKIVPRFNFLLESVRRHKSYFKYQVSAFYHLPLPKKTNISTIRFYEKTPFSIFFEIFFFSKIGNFVIFQDIDLKIWPGGRYFPFLQKLCH